MESCRRKQFLWLQVSVASLGRLWHHSSASSFVIVMLASPFLLAKSSKANKLYSVDIDLKPRFLLMRRKSHMKGARIPFRCFRLPIKSPSFLSIERFLNWRNIKSTLAQRFNIYSKITHGCLNTGVSQQLGYDWKRCFIL